MCYYYVPLPWCLCQYTTVHPGSCQHIGRTGTNCEQLTEARFVFFNTLVPLEQARPRLTACLHMYRSAGRNHVNLVGRSPDLYIDTLCVAVLAQLPISCTLMHDEFVY